MDSFPLDGSDNQFFKLTLFLEKNQSYLCFTKKWRLVTMVSNIFTVRFSFSLNANYLHSSDAIAHLLPFVYANRIVLVKPKEKRQQKFRKK